MKKAAGKLTSGLFYKRIKNKFELLHVFLGHHFAPSGESYIITKSKLIIPTRFYAYFGVNSDKDHIEEGFSILSYYSYLKLYDRFRMRMCRKFVFQ